MKKILLLVLGFVIFGSAVIAFAQSNMNVNDGTVNCVQAPCPGQTNPTTPVTTSMPPMVSTGIACVQTAVVTREAAIGTAFSTFSASMSTALSARATALASAWSLTDGTARRTARNLAWTEYKNASRTAKTVFKTNKKAAWRAFNEASRACRVSVVEYEANDNLSI